MRSLKAAHQEDLQRWTSSACAELDIDTEEVDCTIVLDLARGVHHAVRRPAESISLFLLGVAVGQGMPAAEAAARLARLARRWEGSDLDWRD
jgi:hypothetical protein